jgi:hypothetical protein
LGRANKEKKKKRFLKKIHQIKSNSPKIQLHFIHHLNVLGFFLYQSTVGNAVMMWINGWERCNDVNKTMCNTGSGGWNWAHSILEPITTWQNIVSPYWARHIPTRNRSNRPIPSITQKRVNLLPHCPSFYKIKFALWARRGVNRALRIFCLFYLPQGRKNIVVPNHKSFRLTIIEIELSEEKIK